ncbi:MAG: hypothetical protein D6741_14375, partial [Planctomycetota bacterium]
PYFALCLLSGILACSAFGQGIPPNLPKEDVVDVPAIGDGLCVSNIFQTNMVLQRDKPIRVWGWASPGEKVTVSFAGHEATAEADSDRAWEVVLPAVPATTTPQTMVVRGAEDSLTLENILVGDVWLLGGQSNMEFPITNVEDGELEAASANFPMIRLLTMPHGKGFDSVHSFERLYEWSSWSKRHFRKGDWEICTPETVREFSAIGYVFGRRLHMATGVPIGLIDASIGGTTVETWTPIDVLEKIDGAETQALLQDWAERIASYDPQADLQRRIEAYESRIKSLKERGEPIPPDSRPPNDLRPGPAADRNRPGYCYASVIRPLKGLAIKGAVFHQGFNNCFSGSAGARMYYQVFGKMITAWRNTFGDPQMPFCILSLCTAGAPQTLDNFLVPMYDVGPFIREAQYRTFRDFFDAGDSNIGFASTYDLRKSWYHPQIKIPAGERAAKWALVTQYDVLQGRDAQEFWLPPSIEKVEITDGTIRLTLTTNVRTKDDADGRMLGFAIAGADRIFYPAEIAYYTEPVEGKKPREHRNILILSSPFVPAPVHYRYAWARNPLGNIVNNRGVPLATQRSDDWILEETPVKIELPDGMTPDSARRYIAGRQRKVLEALDLERRLRTAQATVEELTPLVEKAKAALGN